MTEVALIEAVNRSPRVCLATASGNQDRAYDPMARSRRLRCTLSRVYAPCQTFRDHTKGDCQCLYPRGTRPHLESQGIASLSAGKNYLHRPVILLKMCSG